MSDCEVCGRRIAPAILDDRGGIPKDACWRIWPGNEAHGPEMVAAHALECYRTGWQQATLAGVELAKQYGITAQALVDTSLARVEAERERDRVRAALEWAARLPMAKKNRDRIRAALGAEPGDAAATPDALRAVVEDLLSVMEMQEKRESGAFHIPGEVAFGIWADAKKRARDALASAAPLAPTPKGEP